MRFVASQLAKAEGRIRLLDLTTALLGFAALGLAYVVGMVLCDSKLELSPHARAALAVHHPGRQRRLSVRRGRSSVAAAGQSLLRGSAGGATAAGGEEQYRQLGRSARAATAAGHPRRARSARRQGPVARRSGPCHQWPPRRLGGWRRRRVRRRLRRLVLPARPVAVLFAAHPRLQPIRPDRRFDAHAVDDPQARGRQRRPHRRPRHQLRRSTWTERNPTRRRRTRSSCCIATRRASRGWNACCSASASREWTTSLSAIEVKNGLWYRVTGGDAATEEYRIRVRAAPAVTDFLATYHYRPYVARADEVRHERELKALRGTEVALRVRTNRTLREGRLEFESKDGTKAIPGEPAADDPRVLLVRFVLNEDGKYRLHFTSTEGEAYGDPVAYPVTAVPDRPPTVELTKPGQDIRLPADGMLHLEGKASDDLGVKVLVLRLQVVGGETLRGQPYRSERQTATGRRRLPARTGIQGLCGSGSGQKRGGTGFSAAGRHGAGILARSRRRLRLSQSQHRREQALPHPAHRAGEGRVEATATEEAGGTGQKAARGQAGPEAPAGKPDAPAGAQRAGIPQQGRTGQKQRGRQGGRRRPISAEGWRQAGQPGRPGQRRAARRPQQWPG